MPRRAGSADLPLHHGRVPAWLGQRMARLGAVMVEAIVHHYGRDELLRRLAHPFWFQSFGAVMGMDWHSSGITTSVLGALKRGLAPLAGELGIHVCGGRGRHSRQTPHELTAIGDRIGFDGAALAQASRLVAKVDSAAVQDGFDALPARLHRRRRRQVGRGAAGHERRQPAGPPLPLALRAGRRASSTRRTPRSKGAAAGEIVNLADRRAEASRRRQLDLLRDLGPDRHRGRGRGAGDRRRHRRRTSRCCRIWSCRRITTSEPATSCCAGCTARWRPRRIGRRSTSPTCCWCPASAPAPCARWRWWPRSSTARPAASPTPPASRWPMAARTGSRFRCRSPSTTGRSRC